MDTPQFHAYGYLNCKTLLISLLLICDSPLHCLIFLDSALSDVRTCNSDHNTADCKGWWPEISIKFCNLNNHTHEIEEHPLKFASPLP